MRLEAIVSFLLSFALCGPLDGASDAGESLHLATGIKIGEVTADSAIVWIRLTRDAGANREGIPFEPKARTLPEGRALSEMQGSVPGREGEVRLRYRPAGTDAAWTRTAWRPARAARDFTTQIVLAALKPGTGYALVVEARHESTSGGASGATQGEEAGEAGEAGETTLLETAFRTAPAAGVAAPVTFVVVTGQEYHRRDDPEHGHRIYESMLRLEPDFFVHTGDIVYYDKPGPCATTIALARFKWSRVYSMPLQRAFHDRVPSYFIKDDHDTVKNDCWPGQSYGEIGWDAGLALFREQVPMGERTYRTVRWGKDLQIWLLEGRDFRSPNNEPDGPEKTILGAAQKEWLLRTVKASDATFRVVISPTPIVGPDRSNKKDNHANRAFAHEGAEIRSFLGGRKNLFVVCGDRHWQYSSVDPGTGLREFSCGPTTDRHAGGFSESNRSSMHRYLKVRGGFLSATVVRRDGEPSIAFRHHGTDGALFHEAVLRAE